MERGVAELVAQWGALWFLVILTAWMILPRVAEYITSLAESRRQEAQARMEHERIRAERGEKESRERAQRDGQWLALQQQSNSGIEQSRASIDNNTAALKLMTATMERSDEDRHALHTKREDLTCAFLDHDNRARDILNEQKLTNHKIGGSQ